MASKTSLGQSMMAAQLSSLCCSDSLQHDWLQTWSITGETAIAQGEKQESWAGRCLSVQEGRKCRKNMRASFHGRQRHKHSAEERMPAKHVCKYIAGVKEQGRGRHIQQLVQENPPEVLPHPFFFPAPDRFLIMPVTLYKSSTSILIRTECTLHCCGRKSRLSGGRKCTGFVWRATILCPFRSGIAPATFTSAE